MNKEKRRKIHEQNYPDRPTRPVVTELKKECHICPSSWKGTTLYDNVVYIRYRWGILTVSIGSEEDYLTDPEFKIKITVEENSVDGYMTKTKMKHNLKSFIQFQL